MTRSSSDVGRGLAPSRLPRPIQRGERIHVIGAAGAGASAAALLAHHAGASVSGCDPGGPSPYSAALEAAEIDLAWSHSPEHVSGAPGTAPQRLAVTKALTAIDPDHAELVAARRRGIAAEAWQQLVADAAASTNARLVAVAGTHGKSTTTGWLVDLLVRAGRDPSAFVGAILESRLTGGLPATARWGGGDLFIVEADEYAGNFDPYHPSVCLLLNAEWDHPDVFADEEAVVDSFAAWLMRAADAAGRTTLVANVGDAGVRRVIERLEGWTMDVVTVALGGAAMISATAEPIAGAGSRLRVRRMDESQDEFILGLAGGHNAENALALIAAADVLKVADQALRESLADFTGVGRRLELKGEVGGVAVLDDYGHHPTAIARTLDAVRGRYPERRVWAVYEPLTYHRTASMLDRFADVLSRADAVAVADIWAGRDSDTSVTSSAALAEAVSRLGRAPAAASGSPEATADYLAAEVQPGDVVLVMGGGHSYLIARRLVELLGR